MLLKADRYSGDETDGSGTGVGYGAFQAETVVMESHGVLRDVWDMLMRLPSTYPAVVASVSFLRTDDTFEVGAEPRLLGFRPFTEAELAARQPKQASWPFLDLPSKELRGALVVRVGTVEGPIYFLEIQRRLKTSQGDGSEGDSGSDDRVDKERYKGLVFRLEDPAKLGAWVRQFMDGARYSSGVFTSLLKNCPGPSYAYNHVPVSGERYPQERTILRAIALMGIELGPPPSSPKA